MLPSVGRLGRPCACACACALSLSLADWVRLSVCLSSSSFFLLPLLLPLPPLPLLSPSSFAPSFQVHEDLIDAFCDAMVEVVTRFYTTDPKTSKDYGRMVATGHTARMLELIGILDLGFDLTPQRLSTRSLVRVAVLIRYAIAVLWPWFAFSHIGRRDPLRRGRYCGRRWQVRAADAHPVAGPHIKADARGDLRCVARYMPPPPGSCPVLDPDLTDRAL